MPPKLFLRVLALLIPFVITPARPAISTTYEEMPVSAATFVDSIGINIHLHNADTIYGNFPLISSAIFDLGVLHTRDGLILTTWDEYFRRHEALANRGVHCIFISGADDTDAQVLQFAKEMGDATEGLEAPNEFDHTGGLTWADRLLNFLPRLYALSSSAAFPKKMTVIGPSLTQVDSYSKIQSLSSSFDASNMHNYFAGWNPGISGWGNNGYGSIEWNKSESEKAWGMKPLITTETGYTTDLRVDHSVPEYIQALYVPRIFLEQWLHGVHRTYLYELADGNNNVPEIERTYGILRQDGTRKPAFIALQRLIHLLADSTSALPTHPVALELSPANPELHHLLFQKQDGSLYLAFWLETTVFDQRSRSMLAPQTLPFTLRTTSLSNSVYLFSLDPSKPATREPVRASASGEIHLTASSAVSFLKFRSRH
jgi:hypothetical protein